MIKRFNGWLMSFISEGWQDKLGFHYGRQLSVVAALLFLFTATGVGQTPTPTPAPTLGLSWVPGVGGATPTSYKVYKKVGTVYTALLPTVVPVPPATVPPTEYFPVIPGTTYAVTALAGTAESPRSADFLVPVVPPAVPTGLKVILQMTIP